MIVQVNNKYSQSRRGLAQLHEILLDPHWCQFPEKFYKKKSLNDGNLIFI